MAIVEGQLVKMKWSNRNKRYYSDLGYDGFENGKEFLVDVKHLPLGSRALVKFKCDYCGEIHEAKYSGKANNKSHFCTRECQDKFLVGKPSKNPLAKRIHVNCNQCGKSMIRSEWETKKSNHLFCSKECSNEFKKGKEIKKRVERYIITCDNCNKEMTRTKKEIDRAENNFCCKECADEFRRGTINYKLRKGEYVKCHNCNEEFYLPEHRINSQERHFCNNDCRIEWMKTDEYHNIMSDIKGNSKIKTNCKYCGEELEKKPSEFLGHGKHYCSRSCTAKDTLINPNPKKEKIKVNCEICDEPILVHESVAKKNKWHFCGRNCYNIFIARRISNGEFPQTDTSINLKVENILNKLNIVYEKEKFATHYSLDFYLPNHNIVIEVMGDFWHANPIKYDNYNKLYDMQKKDIKRDKSKKTYLTKNKNKRILYLWENDVNNKIKLCENLIMKFINNDDTILNSFNYDIVDDNVDIVNNTLPFFMRTIEDCKNDNT